MKVLVIFTIATITASAVGDQEATENSKSAFKVGLDTKNELRNGNERLIGNDNGYGSGHGFGYGSGYGFGYGSGHGIAYGSGHGGGQGFGFGFGFTGKGFDSGNKIGITKHTMVVDLSPSKPLDVE